VTMLETLREAERAMWSEMFSAHDRLDVDRSLEAAEAFRVAVDDWAQASRILYAESTTRAEMAARGAR
jgi:hypothetical protein